MDAASPLAGAEVEVVDATGKKAKGTTDATGALKLANMAVPYDVSVKHPSAPTPLVVLGRRERSIRLPVWTLPSTPASERRHIFTVQVQVPPCSSSCSLVVVSASLHGGGQTIESIAASPSSQTKSVTLTHGFFRGGMGPSELVRIHAITRNAEQTSWAYREISTTGQRGGASSVAFGSLVPVGIQGSMTVDAIMPDATPNLNPTVGAMLLLAGGARLSLSSAEAPSASFVVPAIPGASLQATSSLRDMTLAQTTDDELYAYSETDPLPLATPSVGVTVYAPPTMTAPLMGGDLPSSAPAITWTTGAPGLGYVELYDLDRKEPVALVLTDERAVPLASLRGLGFALTPSTYAMDISSVANVSLAEVIDGSAPSRRPIAVSGRAQASARAMFRFTISP
ncbi:MAG: hypothetical protein JST00_45820 [Deltaproteobacteria bacterium]|nr:hypothetical protein [Deltaproteobacteria bacterium]